MPENITKTEIQRGRPMGITARGEATKAHIYKTAMALFQRDGFENATLRKIAKTAGVSPGLLYKYYPNKTALVLQLYDELSRNFEDSYQSIAGTSWRIRTVEVLKLSLDSLSQHRYTLTALLPVLVGDKEQNLFAEATKFSRDRVEGGFLFAIQKAKNKPPQEIEEPLARLLYTIHLGVILLWLMDKSPHQVATKQAINLMPTLLWWMSLGLRFSRGQKLVTQLNEIVSKGLIGAEN